MRLLDRVAQEREPVLVEEPGLGTFRLPGASRFAETIKAVESRFVLADDLTLACGGLILDQPDLLADCLDIIRIPSTRMWVEWRICCLRPTRDRGDEVTGQKVGILVETDENGRKGVLRSFWDEDEAADASPATLMFDLDSFDKDAAAASGDALKAILAQTRTVFDQAWEQYYRKAAPAPAVYARVCHELQSTLWRDMLVLLGFSLMSSMKSELSMSRSQLERLNKSRRKRGAAELLDFVEVGATVFARSVNDEASIAGSGVRSAKRLHHVRGHFVRRGDSIFWRRPHLRGDAVLGAAPRRVTRLSLQGTGR